MKNLLNKSLLLIVFAIGTFSCVEEEGPTSAITSFEEFTVTSASVTSFGDVPEADATYTVKFLFDSKQIIDLTLLVEEGPSSQATAGVDFIIIDDHIDVDALTSDSISVQIQVLNDFSPEEDEAIFLQFVGEYGDPRPIEVQVGTILDNGKTVNPGGPEIDITFRWELDDPVLKASTCDLVEDLDITIYDQAGAPYGGGDLLGFAAATLACPETGTVTVSDMVVDEVYNLWYIFFSGQDFSPSFSNDMTVFLDVVREGSELTGTIEIGGFTATDNGVAYIPLTMVRTADDVVTIDFVGGSRTTSEENVYVITDRSELVSMSGLTR